MTYATPRIPVALYRLQFNHTFTFRDAERLVPYLDMLGITDCYASPYLKAVPGSLHGYNIIDPTVLNPEVGQPEDYEAFVHALKSHHMGHILDLVPNHMSIEKSYNPWWLDVLENGPTSRYAGFFDVDWHPVKPELDNKVLLPILGDQYGVVLENQEIALHYQDGAFSVQYYDHHLPTDPRSWVSILTHHLDHVLQQGTPDNPHIQELQSIITALNHLPLRNELDPARVAERHREKEIIKKRLDALTRDSDLVRTFLEERVRVFNGTKGDARSFDLLDGVLRDQAYRLSYWRVASEEINYRRFFDINELGAIRMENPDVFQEFQHLIFRLIREGAVTGIRIDHVDGLYDPAEYLRQWQKWARAELAASSQDRPIFIVVEKILGKGELLSDTWPVYGTTGYDFLNLLNGIFVDPSGERSFEETYARFIQERVKFDDLLYASKKLIMASSMSSEINVLGHQLNQLSERNRRFRDFTLNSLTHAIREIIASFPVYRTYATPDPAETVSDQDRAHIRLAVARAKRRNPAYTGLAIDFVRNLLLKLPDENPEAEWDEITRFVMKFQQTTSPVTAKGLEDTAFYRYNRLISLNEVGGEPERFGVSLSHLHDRMQERQQRWPHAFSSTSTHDTKRSEDVRARINVLSELPKEWRTTVGRWHRLNRRKKRLLDDQKVPDRNEEYLLYQTLIGCWPFDDLNDAEYRTFCDRIHTYMEKALKEAKVHTSWINPSQSYGEAVHEFVEDILDRTRPNPFLDDLRPFQTRIAHYGLYNSLSQVLVKMTGPGSPEFYQGTEFWDFSLVDPDNRRPVDYAHRFRVLEDLKQACDQGDHRGLLNQLMATRTDGRIKMYLIMSVLRYRRAQEALFGDGDYIPLQGIGEKAPHIYAFARRRQGRAVIVAVPRFLTKITPDPINMVPLGAPFWGNTWIGVSSDMRGTAFRNILTDEIVTSIKIDGEEALPLGALFAHIPVACMEQVA